MHVSHLQDSQDTRLTASFRGQPG